MQERRTRGKYLHMVKQSNVKDPCISKRIRIFDCILQFFMWKFSLNYNGRENLIGEDQTDEQTDKQTDRDLAPRTRCLQYFASLPGAK